MVRDAGLEPANLSVLGPKPSAFANFASRAQKKRELSRSGKTRVLTPQIRSVEQKPERRTPILQGTGRGPIV